jgi:hypothetical protein
MLYILDQCGGYRENLAILAEDAVSIELDIAAAETPKYESGSRLLLLRGR